MESEDTKREEDKDKETTKISISGFSIDTSSIPRASLDKQTDELQALGVCVYDQTEFETNVIDQVDKAIQKQEEERRKHEAGRDLKIVLQEIKSVQSRLNHIDKALAIVPANGEINREAKRQVESIKREKENKLKQLKKLEAKRKALNACLNDDDVEMRVLIDELETTGENEDDDDAESLIRLKQLFTQNESENDRLIRTGQMTPFGTVLPSTNQVQRRHCIQISEVPTDFEKFLLSQEKSHLTKKNINSGARSPRKAFKKISRTPEKIKPSCSFDSVSQKDNKQNISNENCKKPEKLLLKPEMKEKATKEIKEYKTDNFVNNSKIDFKSGIIASDLESESLGSDEEYFPELEGYEFSIDYEFGRKRYKRKRKIKDDVPWIEVPKEDSLTKIKKPKRVRDDGCYRAYSKRVKDYRKKCILEKYEKLQNSNEIDEEEEFVEFDGGFKVPMKTWNKLYRYQQTGVRWLWELHQQNCGGIVGDEMGLGKTIQVIVFLAGLQYSKLLTNGDQFSGLGPVVLVAPATVMHQWVKEFHLWCPLLRIAVLHTTGSFTGSKASLIKQINDEHGVLITSYAGVALYQTLLLEYEWHYIILDEGHKIRNPDTKVTLACKQFRTCHRLILSGSPIQNNLKELWSLFDFVYPGKLGTLPVFLQQFAVPITHGGYSNASEIQVQTAYKCATVLRNTIKPYLLRRMKDDVKATIQLPDKNEQVLFCSLTEEQRDLYKEYLSTKEASNIMNGTYQLFVGLITLRKICNHPDIYTGGPNKFNDPSVVGEEMKYGYYKRSGKMMVVKVLLQLWHKQGQKVLFFTQGRQMLMILENFIKSEGYTFISMDGTTSIGSRQPLISKFNSDPDIFIFLLTTRVGGLGVNLTGANRVIIYDPDWNPSTDVQARERAWRIGQERQVTVYRLLTSGTIEEKIYHRQIFKQFLTNRILKDPRQRRFFKTNHLHELFILGDVDSKTKENETSTIFAGTGSEVKVPSKVKRTIRKSPVIKKFSFSEKKIEKMRKLAKQISIKLGKSTTGTPPSLNSLKEKSIENNEVTVNNDEIKNTETKVGKEIILQSFKKKSSSKKDVSNEENKGCEFEGEHVEYLVKQDIYQPETTEEDLELNKKQDDYVLQKLFKKSSVCTVMKHDTIMDSADPDYLLVEGEAERVAKEAVKALKQSRRQCLRAEYGIPTWTGSQGMSGAPSAVRQRFGKKKSIPNFVPSNSDDSIPSSSGCQAKFNEASTSTSSPTDVSELENDKASIVSSSDLLARIKQRSQMISSKANRNENEEEEPNLSDSIQPHTEYDELLVEIINFVAFQAGTDGQATTGELLQAFKDKTPNKSTPIFKALLTRICDFHRSINGDGIWQLKPEFR